MNTLLNNLTDVTNYATTENGALSHKTTKSAVYDMFATGAAYRGRSDEDCILLFKNALEEDESLALKCLFYIRDVRGGQGERRFFRVCYRWLANTYPDVARRNFKLGSEYGRWDDLIYTLIGTPLEKECLELISEQLYLDLECMTPSLLAKWLPSINASAKETKRLGNVIREYLGMSQKQYRQALSTLRERIKVVERLMSAGRWDEIQFDKLPSQAGIKYKNAFARRDIIAKRYEEFAKSKDTTVNATALFPYEVVAKVINDYGYYQPVSDVDKAMIEKYWTNLPDYLEGRPCKMMCVVDTSGSMVCRGSKDSPINVAISLGMYCAERVGGPFKNHYISFASRPQFIKVEGVDFVDKVRRIYHTNLCDNTDLLATFKLLREASKNAKPEDRLDTVVVISDMQIDVGSRFRDGNKVLTEMESERLRWEAEGMEMPHLVYWTVDSRNKANFLDNGPNVTYVSGCSPIIFKQILTGKTGWDLCLETLNSDRYETIK